MPNVKKGEKQNHYMERCVPQLIKEGKNQKQAVAQCLGMFKEKWTRNKSKATIDGIKEPDFDKDNETEMFKIRP